MSISGNKAPKSVAPELRLRVRMGRVLQFIITFILIPTMLYAVDFPLWGTMMGEHDDTRFGWIMADIGDVNGDGYNDLAVADSWFDDGRTIGKVYIWFGGGPFDTVCDAMIQGPDGPGYFGGAICGTGDINGDGYDDFMVGAPNYSGDGLVFVYHGGNPLDTLPDMTLRSPLGDDDRDFGYGIVVGDLNGDSHNDWVIRSKRTVAKLYVYYGPDYEDSIPDKTIYGHNFNYGAYGLLIHELNGDQYDDLVVGAGGAFEGRCYIYWGADTLNDTWQWEDTTRGPFSAGDINGDGFEDLHTDMGIYLGPVDADTLLDYYFPPDGISRHEGATGYFNNDRFADALTVASHVWPETHLAMYLGSPDFDLEVDWEDNRDWGFGWPSMSINLNDDVVEDFVTASWGGGYGRIWVYGGDTTTVTDVEDMSHHNLPSAFSLSAYPNPFNSSTRITYSVPSTAHVKLELFNLAGQKVASLVNEIQSPGRKSIMWEGLDDRGQPVSSGIYFCKISCNNLTKTERMALLR